MCMILQNCHFCPEMPAVTKMADLVNFVKLAICKSNWTEWSTIQGVIARVISNSDQREARGRFEITSTTIP